MRLASIALTSSLAALACPAAAHAQRTLAHDTLSESTPTAVSCGFCVGEAFGVVFRDLPEMRGLEPWQFPVRLARVQIAMGAATVTGSGASAACNGVEGGGTTTASIEVYAGDVTPTGDISDRPAREPWPGETLVFGADEVPITLSSPVTAGGAMFEVTLNAFDLVDEMEMPIVVEPPATYLRVVVWPDAGGASSVCDAAGADAPRGFPLRDADGVVASERSLLYAAGVGWLWNEDAGVSGDWGVRLSLFPLGQLDAGMSQPDAGARDAAAPPMDAGTDIDAGGPAIAPAGGGCICRIARNAAGPDRLVTSAALALACALVARRARRPN